ncbi:MAG: hypothetical protein UU16_C0020G0006 [Candidatus Woesebacteria bacterium GW2011_GWA2_40_7]|uniref:Phosphoesterase RecJ domain protein n=3 Tax=Candidatus Woeseibacteriota TaxID=1752722 RepID=A0A0G0PRY5_9BACT|nr:MAG: hypothetical protein UT17_C0003G0119 [Candidatus Woesebacteria bacterium GW2011_GWB1_39_10]KKR73500.1 MAG: hypothetical protein UU16_C0020G0006 [Candidatus Woesebacteria bacterium GW2011_GWA2_40_7]KKS91056.1 MAG: hypothetical protein UV66_C0001G0413 [Candidatus Woesebacteria bacterium GW2011_GWA1_43_12]
MQDSFSQLIDSATSILVLLPTKPYFDQVAAGLSLYLSLRSGKDVTIASSSPMLVGFNRLIGIDKIVGEIGNKNLTIKFEGYDANNIEKVSYDIEQGEFKLIVVPKTGFVAPQKEQLDLSYAGVASDLVILIGGANDSHFPILSSGDFAGAKVVHIGTRVLASNSEVMSFAKPGASTSELIANLIKENSLNMEPDIATNLIMGVEEGSSNFAGSDVTAETFETFAYLLRSGGQRLPKTRLSPASFPPGAIPTQPFSRPIMNAQPQVPQPQELDAQDINGTQETEQDVNPPDDWLQPKIFKGASTNQPDTYSENKG